MSSTREQNVLTRKKGVVIRQSNDIIEARYNFSLWEMRIFKTMLTRISAGDEAFEQEVLLIRELLAKYEMSDGGKAYELVNEAAKSVKSRFVHIPYFDDRNNRRLKIMPLFTLIDIPTEHADENSYIKLRFNDELKPYLIKLQSRYTSIDEKILAGMDSAYTMRIYELVKENEYKSQGEFGFDEFREIIGAKEYNEDQEVIRDVIRSWQDVKRAILIPSQKHINEHTDITFKFDKVLAEKTGPGRRKVGGVRFYDIKSKIDKSETQPLDISNLPKFQDESNELLALVADFGITRSTIVAWLEKYGKQQVYNGIAYSLEKSKAGKIKDIAAYIYKMVQTSEIINPVVEAEAQTKKRQKKKQKEQTQLKFEKTIEERVKQVQRDFHQAKKQRVADLIKSDEALQSQLLEMLNKEGRESNNPVTSSALAAYENSPGLNQTENFMNNLAGGGSFSGFVLNKVQNLRPDFYRKILTNYRKKIKDAGFDENIIS
jgi:plasmid replication initiation protein